MDKNYTVSATVKNGYNTPLQMEVKAKTSVEAVQKAYYEWTYDEHEHWEWDEHEHWEWDDITVKRVEDELERLRKENRELKREVRQGWGAFFVAIAFAVIWSMC